MHSLKKRVRAAQKEKLALREEILRLRAEREEVALRMDAVRIKHEKESHEALVRTLTMRWVGMWLLMAKQHHINLTKSMEHIDRAVEEGRAALELSPAKEKNAELANLELLISRITDRVEDSLETELDLYSHMFKIPDMNAQTVPIGIEQLVGIQ